MQESVDVINEVCRLVGRGDPQDFVVLGSGVPHSLDVGTNYAGPCGSQLHCDKLFQASR